MYQGVVSVGQIASHQISEGATQTSVIILEYLWWRQLESNNHAGNKNSGEMHSQRAMA